MSCFMMSTQAHATLANTLEFVLNSGFNRFGFEAPKSLHTALKDCRDRYGFYCAGLIYNRLYTLNASAYNGRYRITGEETVAPIPEMPSVPQMVEHRQWGDNHEKLLPWHYKFCKLLDCLIYQASEEATRNDPLLLALIDFNRMYKSFLVSNTDEYRSEPLGDI